MKSGDNVTEAGLASYDWYVLRQRKHVASAQRVAIRKQNLEAHFLCCSDCVVQTADGPQFPQLCMSGKIMLAHYIRTLRE